MNRNGENPATPAASTEERISELAQTQEAKGLITASIPQPYMPGTDKKPSVVKENSGVLLAGAAVVVALILFTFGRISHQTFAHRNSPLSGKQTVAQPADNKSSEASILPITDTTHPQAETARTSVAPDEIARTAKPHSQRSPTADLASVAPFDVPNSWQPTASPQGMQPTSLEERQETRESKNERDAMEKPSLVFVKNMQISAAAPRLQEVNAIADSGIGLPPGTRLRARLESMVTTAVQMPVVAIVEFNYEYNGEIVVPAGTRVFGRMDAADQSGFVSVRFDSMMFPEGSSAKIDASACDLRLRPLRGRVEGRKRTTNILVRSAAGIGEVVATLAGRSNLNQPLSESDLLRERVSNNIAQASDQELNRLTFTGHLVVSVPADTQIYVVLQKSERLPIGKANNLSSSVPSNSGRSFEQLRQLLQLQRELNQEASAPMSSQ